MAEKKEENVSAVAAAREHEPSLAVHISHENSDGTSKHVVGLKNISVILSQEEGYWFARGVQIDYFAEGASRDLAIQNFANGLAKTFKENIRVFGDISKVLTYAPQEVVSEWYKLASGKVEFEMVSTCNIEPFSFAFLEPHRPDQAVA